MGTRNEDKIRKDPLLNKILEEVGHALGLANRESERVKEKVVLNRESLFGKIETFDSPQRKLIAYISRFGNPKSAITPDDIAPIGSMLQNIGTVDYLDLLIHSPGGSGVTAEKIVDMCRRHCKKEFRVIVPNMAKSAATMIALGADAIVMGYCSELGPIDAQTTILVSGVPQQISVQSFIDARKALLKELHDAKSKGQEFVGYLQQLTASTMEPAFINECEREIRFAIDLVKKWLPENMLKAKNPKESLKKRKLRANVIARNLSSANTRFAHGRMISVDECNKIGLNIVELKKENALWNLLWELYVRAEVFMMISSKETQQASKLFMDANSQLMAF
ncbi:MAG: hypothetical protein HY758_03390 [Nitrospirae bacterium]|nr:hypothetical protein [Nitrospirota bacterium]